MLSTGPVDPEMIPLSRSDTVPLFHSYLEPDRYVPTENSARSPGQANASVGCTVMRFEAWWSASISPSCKKLSRDTSSENVVTIICSAVVLRMGLAVVTAFASGLYFMLFFL